jgi:hypothetical protein
VDVEAGHASITAAARGRPGTEGASGSAGQRLVRRGVSITDRVVKRDASRRRTTRRPSATNTPAVRASSGSGMPR